LNHGNGKICLDITSGNSYGFANYFCKIGGHATSVQTIQ